MAVSWPAQKDQAPRVLKTALKPDGHDRPKALQSFTKHYKRVRSASASFLGLLSCDCCVCFVVIAVNPHRASAASSKKHGQRVCEQYFQSLFLTFCDDFYSD